MLTYCACLKEIIPWKISLTAFAKSLRDDPANSHDRCSLEDVAALKTALEDCYGAFGVRVQGRGFLYVPIPGSEANATLLLKYLDKASGKLELFGWWIENSIIPESVPFSVVQRSMRLFFTPTRSRRCWQRKVRMRLGISRAWSAAGIASL
jgi:hypothetical protein